MQAQKDHAGAVRYYSAAVSIRPNSSGAHTSLGRGLRDQGKLAEAIAVLRKAIELSPTTPGTAREDLYELLRGQGKLDDAIAVLRKAVEIDPKYAYAQNNLGVALYNDLKDYDMAVECFRKAIELRPKNALYWVNLSRPLLSQGKHDDAIAACRKAIEIDPNSKEAAHAYFQIGKVLENQGKPDETIACFRKAAELDPNFGLAHSCLAWLLTNCREAKFRDASGGLEAARKAVEVVPKSSLAWQVLGWARYRAGDWKASVEALDKSCDLDDDPKGGNALQWFFLAMAHWQLGEKDTAREFYNRAVQYDPKSEDLRRFRAEAEELLKTAVNEPTTKVESK
jgi:tetratricopeptide (TPR) repeat protein